jgi:hypothetical protein
VLEWVAVTRGGFDGGVTLGATVGVRTADGAVAGARDGAGVAAVAVGGLTLVDVVAGSGDTTAPVGPTDSRETTSIADIAIPTARAPAAHRAIAAGTLAYQDWRGRSSPGPAMS